MQEIAKDESLRSSLETEIRNLTEGIDVGADRQLWLQVLPVSLSQPELGCDSRHMIFRVGMQAEVKASLTKPKAKSWRGLPAAVAMPERDELVVNLTLQGERKSWEELLHAAFVGQDMELSEGTRMRISDCTLEGVGAGLAVRLAFQLQSARCLERKPHRQLGAHPFQGAVANPHLRSFRKFHVLANDRCAQ